MCTLGLLLLLATPGRPLELAGPANPWRFVNAVGERGGVWGFENGRLEGWVYPLKIFHDFHLTFQLEGLPRAWSGDELARTVRVRPHQVELLYAAEQFTVRETLFAPRHEPGFAVLVEAEAPVPLRVMARFRPDLNLMWPAALGGQTTAWEAEHKWLRLAEPSGRFSALIGSPAAVGSTAVGYHAYLSDAQPHEALELRLAPGERAAIVVTGGIQGRYDAAAAYRRLAAGLPELIDEAARHYSALEAAGAEFLTPDAEVNRALRWARVSLEQLKVCNPYVGCSYVSGYGSSGTGTRPMYAWFFDEPTITSWAYLASGETEAVREAFRFLQKYQREDGKIPHEVSQSAPLIDWFRGYSYAYIHPDAPLWYLIALGHYWRFTGDEAFLRESWPSARKAYGYCLSILDASDGLPVIPQGEWGSIEEASFRKDAAMAGEWIAALRAVRTMAARMGETALAEECERRERQAAASLERTFWDPARGYYHYGLDTAGGPVTWLNPMIAFSAWFGSLPDARARAVAERLAGSDFLADWGQRNISLEDPRYAEGSYTTGSVWPFMTAGALLAQFRHHHAAQALLTWRAMVRLRDLNARGAMPEVLSGRFYRLLDNAVPHQMFSEVAVIPGLVNGILGLEPDVPGRALELAPHLPPSWPSVLLRRFPYGRARLDLTLRQAAGELRARLETSLADPVTLHFAPALPAGAKVLGVEQDGKPARFETADYASDVHARVTLSFVRATEVVVRYRGGVALEIEAEPLLEGETSRNLRVLRTQWKSGRLELLLEGRPGRVYRARANGRALELAPPAGLAPNSTGYVRWTASTAPE